MKSELRRLSSRRWPALPKVILKRCLCKLNQFGVPPCFMLMICSTSRKISKNCITPIQHSENQTRKSQCGLSFRHLPPVSCHFLSKPTLFSKMEKHLCPLSRTLDLQKKKFPNPMILIIKEISNLLAVKPMGSKGWTSSFSANSSR